MNTSDFVFGGITDTKPTFLVNLFDSTGINTVGNGIGHDISVVLDDKTNDVIILNDFYEASLDNFQKGTVSYPFNELPIGRHTLTLKAWDINNNSSEDFIEFYVEESSELVIDHILNYPNPFTTSTDFYFDHNQAGEDLQVIIQIYTISGRLVKSISTNIISSGYRSEPIHWDGRDDYGSKIGRGVYIYRVRVKSETGNIVNKFEKLVILK